MKLNTIHIWWGLIIISSLTLIGIILITCFNSTYTINLNMDNNTLEAIKSINWSAMPK